MSSLALLLTGSPLGAGAAHTPPPRRIAGRIVPQWQWALLVRSRALDKRYHLGRQHKPDPRAIKITKQISWVQP